MNAAKINELLLMSHDPDPNRRRTAVRELCPCEVRTNHAEVWDRILELVKDPDVGVRRFAFHAMIDGSPRSREHEIIEAVAALRDDASSRLKRQARKLMATYRRTGRINLGDV